MEKNTRYSRFLIYWLVARPKKPLSLSSEILFSKYNVAHTSFHLCIRKPVKPPIPECFICVARFSSQLACLTNRALDIQNTIIIKCYWQQFPTLISAKLWGVFPKMYTRSLPGTGMNMWNNLSSHRQFSLVSPPTWTVTITRLSATSTFSSHYANHYVIQIFWYVIGLFNGPQTNRKDNEKGMLFGCQQPVLLGERCVTSKKNGCEGDYSSSGFLTLP